MSCKKCILYIVQCTMYALQYTLYRVYFTQYTAHSYPYTFNRIACLVCVPCVEMYKHVHIVVLKPYQRMHYIILFEEDMIFTESIKLYTTMPISQKLYEQCPCNSTTYGSKRTIYYCVWCSYRITVRQLFVSEVHILI